MKKLLLVIALLVLTAIVVGWIVSSAIRLPHPPNIDWSDR